jgi:hypothetical protein
MKRTVKELHALRREAWKATRNMPNQSGMFSEPDSQGLMATFGRHRDSEPLDRANFKAAKDIFEAAGIGTTILSFGHWAVGWSESLFVPATMKATAILAELQNRLASYPVLDEEALSEEEELDGGYCQNCGQTGHHAGEDSRCGSEYERCKDCGLLLDDYERREGEAVSCYDCRREDD